LLLLPTPVLNGPHTRGTEPCRPAPNFSLTIVTCDGNAEVQDTTEAIDAPAT